MIVSAELVEPDLRASEDFDVHVTVRVPRDVFKRLRWAAEGRQTTPGRLASAIVAASFGTEVVPERDVSERPKPRLSNPAVVADIRTMAAAGLSVGDIAANLDVKRATALAWLRELELVEGSKPVRAPRSKGVRPFSDPEKVDTFLRMYGEGYSDEQIARAVGCTYESVRRQRKMRGLLPQSERGRR